MVDLNLDEDAPLPLYRQLYAQLRDGILGGELFAGHRLPATRALADQLGVARVTVQQAYNQLAAEGYVVSRPGAGTFVVESLPPAPAEERPFVPRLSHWGERVTRTAGSPARPQRTARADFIDFGFGRSFPHIFPYDVWRRLLGRYLSTDDVMLSRYGSVAGFEPLRAAIAGYLRRWRDVRCSTEQVVIVNGLQQALDILARLLLQAGDNVLVESPGYTDAFALLRVHGAHLVPLPVDEHGFPVEAIPAGVPARLAFVTPANQFPRGGAMPLARRLALLHWAQENESLILEDDYDGALRYTGRPLGALQGLDECGHVVYLGSFSKVLFPALRLGYVVLPEPLLQPFVQAKGIVDRGAPTLTQAAVADFITEGYFERHLRRLRRVYGRRRRILTAALENELPCPVTFSSEPAGLHIMLTLTEDYEEATVIRDAAAAGVGVNPGAAYYLQKEPPPSILLGFSGLSEAQLREGVRRLASALC
ncbi:MAG: PLP-dependent aminotransferase family protein [Anaerolineae bacterium]|nr:PLP-dependent aminotransferase family protein [Anaerolineae bacterium]